jgi:hypothetical protein
MLCIPTLFYIDIGQIKIYIEFSFDVSDEDSYHCKHPENTFNKAGNFKIISLKNPGIFEVQFHGQYFDIKTNALGASWAGRCILLRHRHWILLLRTMFIRHDAVFGLRTTRKGYMIRGSCCAHGTEVTRSELEMCWEGRILLTEFGESKRKRFIKHARRQFTLYMGR